MINAATLLVSVKTKLGKTVPDYAKKLASDHTDGNMARAERELFDMLTTMRSTTRKQLFAEDTSLHAWFVEQTCEV